jgi:di/tricarboxylate transporter
MHPPDASTATVAAIAVLLLPGIGVITWREAQARVAWGTIVLLGVAISLGTVLLRSGAAAWLAGNTFGAVGWAA